MPSVKNHRKLLVNTALIAILFVFLPGSNANAQDVSYKGDGVALEGFETQEHEEISNVTGSSEPGVPSHAPAAAPRFFGKCLLWHQACTASALVRSCS